MKRKLVWILVSFSLLCGFLFGSLFFLQKNENRVQPLPDFETTKIGSVDIFAKGKITEIVESGSVEDLGENLPFQKVKVKLVSGKEKGTEIIAEYGTHTKIEEDQKLKEGESVVVSKSTLTYEETFFKVNEKYYVTDHYRSNKLIILVGIFLFFALLIGGFKALSSLFGMGITVLIVFYFIIPQVLAGKDPFLVTVLSCFFILLVSLYISHGFNKRSSVAVLGAMITLAVSVLINLFFVTYAKLFGTGTEEAFYLRFGDLSLNPKGILLGGILIGVLGVLDDICTAQSAAVEEIAKANPLLTKIELFKRGMSIGREHISSLINTLFLAYVGVSFPILLLFMIQKTQPFWITLNSPFIGEEVIRTLVGSFALLISVPITNALAAYFFGKNHVTDKK